MAIIYLAPENGNYPKKIEKLIKKCYNGRNFLNKNENKNWSNGLITRSRY